MKLNSITAFFKAPIVPPNIYVADNDGSPWLDQELITLYYRPASIRQYAWRLLLDLKYLTAEKIAKDIKINCHSQFFPAICLSSKVAK